MENESRSFANQESFSYKGVPCPFIYLPTLSLNWIANMFLTTFPFTQTILSLGLSLTYVQINSLYFQMLWFYFVRRQANRVAHSLARASRLYSSPYHFDFIPPCIETLIINEMILFSLAHEVLFEFVVSTITQLLLFFF